jgi:hypothetical protein
MKKIISFHIYNLGFFGGNREGKLNVDGQYKVVTDLSEFILLKVGGYGNLISFPKVENPKPETLSENDYRFVHDALLGHLPKDTELNEGANESDVKQFNEATRYKIHGKRISANIGIGDKVINLKTGEIIKVDYGYDVHYLNRNHNWKLVDRELHPEAETLETLIKTNESKNPFESWTKLDAMPKKDKNWIVDHYIINGETYTAVLDYTGNGRYIIKTPQGEIYEKKSSTSAPFYDTIDILVGKVKAEYEDGNRFEYTFKDVVHEREGNQEYFVPTRFRKMTEQASYEYNTRLTYF